MQRFVVALIIVYTTRPRTKTIFKLRQPYKLQDVVVREPWPGVVPLLDDARQVLPDVVDVQQFTQLLVLRRRKLADAGVQCQLQRWLSSAV